ncbi:MAG: BtpA/SgcQ family protein [Deltaproteobacteria bacterium]
MNPFTDRKPLVGVIHLPALPGAPRHTQTMDALVEGAVRDAALLAEAGFDAVLIENFGDVPFYRDAVPPETIAAMAVIGDAVRRTSGLPLGINVLRNDAISALGIAVATQARFVRVNVIVGARVTDQGIIQSDAARVARVRTALGAQNVALLADVDVKHSAAIAPIRVDDEAIEAHERSLADVIVVTGARTGLPTERDTLLAVKSSTGAPVWLGSGVTSESLAQWLEVADGVIVGSALRGNGRAGGPIDLARAKAFVQGRTASVLG